MTLLVKWIASAPGNSTKLEENARKMAMRNSSSSAEKKRLAEKKEKLSVISDILDKKECPLDRMAVSSVIDGLCAAVELRLKIASEEGVPVASTLGSYKCQLLCVWGGGVETLHL